MSGKGNRPYKAGYFLGLILAGTAAFAQTPVYGWTFLEAGVKFVAEGQRLIPDEFAIGQLGTAVFRRDASGHVSGLSIYSGRIRDVAFVRTSGSSH